jgi:hypothetical protein
MDCERFEANLIDELYEELDELTSAAAKRHVAGCARCASLMGGLRATRRVAVLPIVEPSIDLEDRILASVRNAQKVVPIGRRFSRAISMAGSWAMRPQTAMAAVFVLMVGSSLLFVRRGRVAASDSLRVTAQGEPAASVAFGSSSDQANAPLDSKAAAAAHGAPRPAYAPPPAPMASALATAAPNEAPIATLKERSVLPKGIGDSVGNGYDRDEESSRRGAANAAPPAGAPAAVPPARLASKDDAPLPSDLDKVEPLKQSQWAGGKTSGSGAGGVGNTTAGQASTPGVANQAQAAPNANLDLQAANNERDTRGCGVAADSYDRIAQQAWGTTSGYDAQWKAAECYRALGKNDLAQARYSKLLTVTQYATQAQRQIAAMGQVAAARAVKKAAPSKPSAPAAPPQSTSAPQQQQAPTQATPAGL